MVNPSPLLGDFSLSTDVFIPFPTSISLFAALQSIVMVSGAGAVQYENARKHRLHTCRALAQVVYVAMVWFMPIVDKWFHEVGGGGGSAALRFPAAAPAVGANV